MSFLRRHSTPRLFSSNPAGPVRLLLLATLCLALMFYDHQRGRLAALHATLSTLVYPVQAAVNLPYALIGWAQHQLQTHAALVAENAALKRQALVAAAELQRLAALQQENARLRELLNAADRLSGRVVAAELLAVSLNPFRHTVVINKGSRDGVFEGQTLLDAHGLVGQVLRVGPLSAEAALITDPSQAIQVEINRTGLRTLAVGTADADQLSLPYLPNNADVKVGDLLVSSGLEGHYPPGYPVGVVSSVVRNPAESFATVTARPTANLDHGREVLLYFPAKPPPPLIRPAPRPAPRHRGKKTAPGKSR